MDYKTLTLKLIDILQKVKIPYMFVGGLVADYYGFARATYDIDVVLALKERHIKPLIEKLKDLEFDLREDGLRMLLKATNRFMARSPRTDHRIDFWIPKTEFEKRAFERRKRGTLFKRGVWLASPEDLILLKLLSSRGRDIEDIIGILTRQGKRLNMDYLSYNAKVLNRHKELKDLIREARKYI